MAGQKYDVKITVLKKLEVPDVHKEYAAENVHINCAKYKEGQSYLCKNVEKPEGFCSWAWVAVQRTRLFSLLSDTTILGLSRKA